MKVIKPIGDRVLVKRIEAETKSAGGIIIPDTAKEKPMEGEIIEVGSGHRDDKGNVTPFEVKKGDRVLFGKWGGNEVKINGEEMIILKEQDILAIVK